MGVCCSKHTFVCCAPPSLRQDDLDTLSHDSDEPEMLMKTEIQDDLQTVVQEAKEASQKLSHLNSKHTDQIISQLDDGTHSENVSYSSNSVMPIKKKELFTKAEDSKICCWFRNYIQELTNSLPTYIMFSNQHNCFIDHWVGQIKAELDKSVQSIPNEKRYMFFHNVIEFDAFCQKVCCTTQNNMNKIDGYANVVQNKTVKKYVQYRHINLYKNIVKPFVLYKKLKIKYDVYYVPLHSFNAVKTQTDIIKTIQMLELLGCKELYLEDKEVDESSKQFISELNVGFIVENNGVMSKKYSEKNTQRNNSYEFIDKLFLTEEELLTYIDLNTHIFMDHSDYLTDIELRFLIRSRINSYLQEYSRSFTLQKLNAMEFNTQLIVKKIYKKIGLKFKYNTESYKELSFKIDCVFFSLNEIIDTSSLPLDAIGFNIIKNKLFEKNSDILRYTDDEPCVNNTVIVVVNDNKVFGQVVAVETSQNVGGNNRSSSDSSSSGSSSSTSSSSVNDGNSQSINGSNGSSSIVEVRLFNSSAESVKTDRLNVRCFEFVDEVDNMKFIKEIKRFIQKTLAYKYQRYKQYIRNNKESFYHHREDYNSYFSCLCQHPKMVELIEQIETYTDVKEIISHVKYSGFFVYLNKYGFEKMKQYTAHLQDSKLLECNYKMFLRRFLYFNDVNIAGSLFDTILKEFKVNVSQFRTFKDVDILLSRIFQHWKFCPLTPPAVNHFFSTLPISRYSGWYKDEWTGKTLRLVQPFVLRFLQEMINSSSRPFCICPEVKKFVKEHLEGFLQTNPPQELTVVFIQNLYDLIHQRPSLFSPKSTPSYSLRIAEESLQELESVDVIDADAQTKEEQSPAQSSSASDVPSASVTAEIYTLCGEHNSESLHVINEQKVPADNASPSNSVSPRTLTNICEEILSGFTADSESADSETVEAKELEIEEELLEEELPC